MQLHFRYIVEEAYIFRKRQNPWKARILYMQLQFIDFSGFVCKTAAALDVAQHSNQLPLYSN